METWNASKEENIELSNCSCSISVFSKGHNYATHS